MIFGFLGAVHAIRSLNQFGSSNSTSGKSINLCPTRVTEIAVHGGVSVVQEGMAWFRKMNGQLEELDPIAVEKWFGRHCVVDADAAEAPTGSGETLATLAFVSGPPRALFSTNAGVFTWNEQAFTSAELAEALKTLADLPIRLRPSR
jgi:hypothetical protein